MKLLPPLAILGLATLTLGALPLVLPFQAEGVAFADSGKDQSPGNSGDRGPDKSETGSGSNGNADKVNSSSHGALASELKGMNAIHASANALANANPNSQVGRIASYQAAARGTLSGAETVTQHANELLAAQDDLTTAQEELAAAVASGDATAEEIAALQADVTAGEGAVLTAEAGLRDAQQDLGELTEAEAAALLTATGGRVLSPAALAYVRSELNI